MSEKMFFPGKGNIMEFDREDKDDDLNRGGNLPIDERLKNAEKWRKEEKEREERLKKIKEKQAQPVVPDFEVKELTIEQKRIKLEKLRDYLKDLKEGNAPRVVKGKDGVVMEEELENIKLQIEKIEEELNEK